MLPFGGKKRPHESTDGWYLHADNYRPSDLRWMTLSPTCSTGAVNINHFSFVSQYHLVFIKNYSYYAKSYKLKCSFIHNGATIGSRIINWIAGVCTKATCCCQGSFIKCHKDLSPFCGVSWLTLNLCQAAFQDNKHAERHGGI